MDLRRVALCDGRVIAGLRKLAAHDFAPHDQQEEKGGNYMYSRHGHPLAREWPRGKEAGTGGSARRRAPGGSGCSLEDRAAHGERIRRGVEECL